LDDRSVLTPDEPGPDDSVQIDSPSIEVPLAIAHVYNLPVISSTAMEVPPPENPTVQQLKATVVVRLPPEGGRLERIPNTRRVAFLERDRFGVPKRTVWVDKHGKVFAEVVDGDDEDSTKRGNTIRLGLVSVIECLLCVLLWFVRLRLTHSIYHPSSVTGRLYLLQHLGGQGCSVLLHDICRLHVSHSSRLGRHLGVAFRLPSCSSSLAY
jgi:hypothetical protein